MDLMSLVGAWLMFAAGCAAASAVAIVGTLFFYMDGSDGGARRVRSRPEAGAGDGICRRGDGSPRRCPHRELVDQLVNGTLSIDEVREFYQGRNG